MEIENVLEKYSLLKQNVAFALFEQNDLDLETENKSYPRGDIYFHSHNYPYLFKKKEWNIVSQEIKYNNRMLNDYSITMVAHHQK